MSGSYLNQVVNAVRYYYKEVLGDAHRVRNSLNGRTASANYQKCSAGKK
ncbi:MAG: hypothetical protein IPI91_20825 [Flavobacteriales bacterium]|nr:hypothetical protein [Flavobacteriales bacterium]